MSIYCLGEPSERIREIEEGVLDLMSDAGTSDDLDCLKNVRELLTRLSEKCELVSLISERRVRIAKSKEQKELNAEFDKTKGIIDSSEEDARKLREAIERNRRASTIGG